MIYINLMVKINISNGWKWRFQNSDVRKIRWIYFTCKSESWYFIYKTHGL